MRVYLTLEGLAGKEAKPHLGAIEIITFRINAIEREMNFQKGIDADSSKLMAAIYNDQKFPSGKLELEQGIIWMKEISITTYQISDSNDGLLESVQMLFKEINYPPFKRT